ncbi:MAG: hypothetical protein V4643_08045 [Bacteroidota bacterium]
MKTTLLHIIFLLLTVTTFGQTPLLKKYDFEKGGYYILGTFAEGDRNSLRDSIGEFYTDSIPILNQFKKEWTFKKPSPKYACGYHYEVSICKNGLILESFLINLSCNEIVSNNGYFYFDTKKLSVFYAKLKKPYRKSMDFISLTEARNYRTKILNNSSLIMSPTPNWIKFEGTFQFTYECPKGSTDCNYDNKQKKLKEIELKIKNIFPNENFELEERGGSLTSIIVEVKCNQSLSDKFNIYKRDTNSYFGKWTPYRLSLTTYWATKQK